MVAITWQPRGDVTLHFHISTKFSLFVILLLNIIVEIVDITVVKHVMRLSTI